MTPASGESEAEMEDERTAFLTQMRARLDAARGVAAPWQADLDRQRQVASALYEWAITRFQLLAQTLPADFEGADKAGPDAGQRTGTPKWKATNPERSIELVFDRTRGQLRGVWHVSEPRAASPSYLLDLKSDATLEEIFAGLADQATWQAGRFPALPGTVAPPEA